MFLVEPGSGSHKSYGSAQELGAAIRRGELSGQARIYHRAAERWLPITVHPEYRRVAADHEMRSALALRMRQWTFLPGESGQPELPADAAAPEPAETDGSTRRSWLGSTMLKLRGLAHR